MQSARTFGDVGGGITSFGTGAVTLQQSTVSDNRSLSGAGVLVSGGSFTLVHGTVSGNDADFDGGGISGNGVLKIVRSTVSGNSAGLDGVGILNSGGTTVFDDKRDQRHVPNDCVGC